MCRLPFLLKQFAEGAYVDRLRPRAGPCDRSVRR